MSMYSGLQQNFERLERLGWFIPNSHPVRFEPDGARKYGVRRAAVLFVISRRSDGELQVLLTKRSNNVRVHKGQICLPGGHQDHDNEGPVETALREAMEEVHLDAKLVRIISTLPAFPADLPKPLGVTPVVCVLEGRPEDLKLVPNEEVEYTFWAPLRLFLETKNHTTSEYRWKYQPKHVHFFHYTGPIADKARANSGMTGGQESKDTKHVIWGLTAYICTLVSAIALDRVPQFPFLVCGISSVESTAVLRELAFSPSQFESTNGTHTTGVEIVKAKL